MSFLTALLKTKQSIDSRVRIALGQATPESLSLIRQKIIGDIETRIVMDGQSRYLPFQRVLVLLHPRSDDQRDAVQKELLDNHELGHEIINRLNDLKVKRPDGFEAVVAIGDNSFLRSPETDSFYEIELVGSEPYQKKGAPESRIDVKKGSAEHARYTMRKERILVGRLAEVTDREGRIVRKNDIVFLENGSEANSSVEQAHARIWFDFEKGDFFILDEGSHYGTRIVRNDRAIEVPGVDSHGIPLESGDDIYLGQAWLHFEAEQP